MELVAVEEELAVQGLVVADLVAVEAELAVQGLVVVDLVAVEAELVFAGAELVPAEEVFMAVVDLVSAGEESTLAHGRTIAIQVATLEAMAIMQTKVATTIGGLLTIPRKILG